MATVLTSYTLVPELQHYYNRFLLNVAIVTKDLIPPPVDIPELYMPTNSFIQMLFDNDYCQSSYEYRYKQQTNVLCIPRVAYDRMQIYPGSSQYVELDPTGDNIFALEGDDFTLLDALLKYRTLTCDSTGVVTACGVVDSTSFQLLVIDSPTVDFTCDSTTGICILQASLTSLSTELSKLIYLYLDLKVNGRFDKYNNTTLISTGGLLESCYESYLINQYYICMSSETIIFPDC